MLKGRGRDPRSFAPQHTTGRPGTLTSRAPLVKPEPDYEVVEFPTENYVNAKLQPPPPPPRPPPGQSQVISSCGLCGGGGARVRCAECGPRALCASCDDMYHRHPKRRHHQRQALPLSSSNVPRVELPPLPPKATPPVPPPRRHKMSGDRSSASPRPAPDQRRSTLGTLNVVPGLHVQPSPVPFNNHTGPQVRQQVFPHQMNKMPQPSAHLGSMPYLPSTLHHPTPVAQAPSHINTMGHLSATWNRPRGSLSSYNVTPNMDAPMQVWEGPDSLSNESQSWDRPMRRGASVLELSGAGGCPGCAGCAAGAVPPAWRYGSCADLHHPFYPPAWLQPCCAPHPAQSLHPHPHTHAHPPRTPQLGRRVALGSGSLSRLGSRAVSPAGSVRSRVSRRSRLRSPSPPRSCSSDADSESDGRDVAPTQQENEGRNSSLGPAPVAADAPWQCEHCTFVNEPGTRVCAVCCRTPTAEPRLVTAEVEAAVARIKLSNDSPPPERKNETRPRSRRNSESTKSLPKKERASTGCGPSPPREEKKCKKSTNHSVSLSRQESTERSRRHDMAVGPSPPKEVQPLNNTRSSPFRQENKVEPQKHSISVGSSPPRTTSVSTNVEKKSTGTSPPRDSVPERRPSVTSTRSKSNTGTSPPPQSISTQTYEAPSTWERAPSEPRSRPRRRPRDDRRDDRRDRSHSRHSLSSETRESERSARTVSGRWEWREPRDSSPGDWSGSERRRGPGGGGAAARLTRRASHLDLRRNRNSRNSAYYGSGAASPEPLSSNRTLSLEALVAAESKREAERGLELARLMAEAEKLGYSAVEVQAALVQSPAAPLAWLRTRWAGLTAGVRAAATRLAPDARITEREARAALARHRGAMWPAVTECVDTYRQQVEEINNSKEGRVRGHVWGPPAGADDDAAPPLSSRLPRRLREDSSDEFDLPTQTEFQDDQWMNLHSDINVPNICDIDNCTEPWNNRTDSKPPNNTDDIVNKLKFLLAQSGVPTIDDNLLLKGLMANKTIAHNIPQNSNQAIDLGQSENDFIDAYNALTRSSPLLNINNNINHLNSIPLAPNEHEILSNNHNTNEVKDSKNLQNSNISFNNSAPQSNDKPIGLKNNSTTNSLPQNIEKKIENQNIHEATNTSQLSNSEDFFSSSSKNQISSSSKIDSPQTISNTEEINNDKAFNGQEKSNNLIDIFDDTQKLIQKMKDEINSDINSLDGVSHSDAENSSNIDTSEHETTHSESEEETDEISSDEKRSLHSQGVDQSRSEHHTFMTNRTSSEDTEQFEEAIDQFEDYQQSNIEMLDSIARSLQKEHVVTVEVNQSPSSNYLKTQDLNNNFAVVNSFEEIYDELKTSEKTVGPQITNTFKTRKKGVNHSVAPNNDDIKNKQEIAFCSSNLELPTKLIITETVNKIYNAELEHVESPSSDSNEEEIQEGKEINQPNTDLSEILDSETLNLNPVTTLSNKNSAFDIQNMTEVIIQEDISKETTRGFDTLKDSVSPAKEYKQNIHNNNEILQETNAHFSNDINIASISNEETLPKNEISIDNQSHQNTQLEKDNTTPDNDSPITDDKNNSKMSPIKSNIPKLIKVLQNNKQKAEKVSKVIASKVPVRRSSIKQYPAPAPPKNKFGNIQFGHVKQLQTRLFSKPVKAATNTNSNAIVNESKPTTPMTIKKKHAPPPPIMKEQEFNPSEPTKSSNSPKESPTKEKKRPYFRETCGTDDEWTESDTDNTSINTLRPTQEPKQSPPPPPPPLTLRRVSGQLIDLADVRLAEGSPERQARMLLAEGATESWEQARLAVELATRGTDLPAALLAALECADLATALAYLHQDCELCASRCPEHEMVSMLRCVHRCCRECARHYFTVQVTERSIADCVCPYCKEPELETLPEDAWLEYFAHLDILLKTLLETDVHELFQRKLRDRTLARDPNFRWCVDCSSGFFVHPKHKRLRCPECRSVSCAKCRKPWTGAHEGLSCEQYAAWLDDNDPDRAVAAVQQHLKENGLDCPRCHFRYSLSRGGCMHFTCTQCKYEFCYGCGKPFMMGAQCGLSEYCAKLGLHAHHPRNCLFYLRDKEPHELQTLLQMNNVSYETEAPEGGSGRCPVQLQRETPAGLIDGVCGNDVPPKHAGLCKVHYVEYLAGLARPLDPIPIMEVSELVAELRRRALPLPDRGPWDTDPIYAGMCAEIVKEKIPLD